MSIWASLLNAGCFHRKFAVNAKDYGAVGDGVADDTSALQAAFAAADSGTCYVPSGTYKISATLNMNTTPGFSIRGDGRYSTIISKTTNTGPILRVDAGDGENTYGNVIEDIQLSFTTQSTTSNTDAFGIQIVGGATLSGVFHWTVRNVLIQRTYIGIGFGSGNAIIWGSAFEKVEVRDCNGSGFKFWCTTGGPRLLFRDCIVWNGSSSMAPAEAAVNLSSCYAHITGLEVLNWSNRPIVQYSSVATPLVLENVNVEGSDWSNGTFVRLFYIVDSGALIRQVQIRGTSSAGTTVYGFDSTDTGSFDIDGVEFDITLDGGWSAGFNQVRDVRHRRLIQTQALSALYYDGDTSKWVAQNHSTTIFTKAGAPEDSDFVAPTDGLMALDETNHRLYVRVASAWKYAELGG